MIEGNQFTSRAEHEGNKQGAESQPKISISMVLGLRNIQKTTNMAIFKTREAAEQFVTEDPCILEGLVKSFAIWDSNDTMLGQSLTSRYAKKCT